MSRVRGAFSAALVALVARLLVIAWGYDLPPAGDGTYYDALARRLATGQGYTWLWPDGAVTYAAHYPVGYPAIIALGYAIFGPHPIVAMLENALLGALLAASVVVLTRGNGSENEENFRGARFSLLAGIIVALHPALVPYTLALMTEGAAIALLAATVALVQLATSVRAEDAPKAASRRRFGLVVAAALVLALATLVRPQCLLMAPVLGALLVSRASRTTRATMRARVISAAAFSLGVALAIAPWTARNCVRMERCALVSVNGGWNLLIGTQTQNGSFATVEVPDECKTVWSEAGKDRCFEDAAKRAIGAHPIAWLAKSPRKLGTTFDYFGAAPWYIEAADEARVNAAKARGVILPRRFEYKDKVALGTLETIVSRALLGFALFSLGVLGRRGSRRIAGIFAVLTVFLPWGTVPILVLAALAILEPKRLSHAVVLRVAAIAVILETCMLHAAFFGGGRYGLVTIPFVVALGFSCLARSRDATSAPVDAEQAIAG